MVGKISERTLATLRKNAAARRLPEKACEQCGDVFKPTHSWNRFCGRACGVLGRSGPTRKASAGTNSRCGYCGKAFYRQPNKLYNVCYCSKSCFVNHKRIRTLGSDNPNYRGAGWKTCEGCGESYKSYDARRRFCGVTCSQSLSQNEYLANHRKGIAAEILCAKELRGRGYSVCRSAGSRGEFDVIAVNESEVLLVQVATTKHRARRFARKKLRKLQRVACPVGAKKELWVLVDGHGWFIQEATR